MNNLLPRQDALPPPNPAVAAVVAEGVDIPIVDVGPMLRGEPGALDRLAADVRLISARLGFMCIVNHGVPWSLVENAVTQTLELFHLPEEELLKSRARFHHQGYWPSGVGRNARTFQKEAARASYGSGWALFRERAADDPDVLANKRHRAQNLWPDPALLPDFRHHILQYQSAMLELGLKMVRVYARVLDLPAGFFDHDFARPEFHNRLNYYPHREPEEGVIAQSAHFDHCFLTLLPMSPVPGLQVKKPGDTTTWINARYVDQGIIVNTGEWLNRLSNRRIIPTPHRVMNPPEERVTVPFFLNGGDDMVCNPVPTCIAPGETPAFAAETFHEFFEAYLEGSYRNRQ